MINGARTTEAVDQSIEKNIENNKITLMNLCRQLYNAFDNPVVTEHYPVTTVAAEHLPEEERPQLITIDIDGVNYEVARIREPRGYLSKGVDINHVQIMADGSFYAIGTIDVLQVRPSWLAHSDEGGLDKDQLLIQQQERLIKIIESLLSALDISQLEAETVSVATTTDSAPMIATAEIDPAEVDRQINLARIWMQSIGTDHELGEMITRLKGRHGDNLETIAQQLVAQNIFFKSADCPNPLGIARAVVKRHNQFGERLRAQDSLF